MHLGSGDKGASETIWPREATLRRQVYHPILMLEVDCDLDVKWQVLSRRQQILFYPCFKRRSLN